MQQFDPNQPFQRAGGNALEFDPNAPFERSSNDTRTADDILGQIGGDPNVTPLAQQPKRPQHGNLVSRAIGEFGDRPALPGPLGGAIQGAARIGQSVAEDPLQTLVIGPLSAPGRIVPNLREGGQALSEGRPLGALGEFAEAATAVGETGLIGAPIASVGRSGLKAAGSQAIDDFARVGVDPTLPAVSQTAARIAKPVSENFAGGATARSGADRVLKQTEQALNNAADDFSRGAGPIDSGAAARAGVVRFNSRSPAPFTPDGLATRIIQPSRFSTFRDKAEAIYSKAWQGVDTATVGGLDNTADALRLANSKFSNETLQEIFKLPIVKQIEGAVSDGLSIADMHALRTTVRELRAKPSVMQSKDDAAIGRLESALTKDIYKAVEATGGPKARARLKRADKFYRLGAERLTKALKEFLKDDVTSEDAFKAILSATRGQGKGDIQRLRALRRSLRPDEMDEISAGVLREMGKAKEGADFSSEVFARAWQNMGDDAKGALFNRAQRPEVRQNLDALARVIERQAKVEGLSNRSQSGASLGNVATGAAALNAPISTMSAIVGANIFGRLMMSPAFTKALLKMSRHTGAIRATSDRARIISIIGVAGESDQAIKPYTDEIIAALRAENDNLRSTTSQPLKAGQKRQQ